MCRFKSSLPARGAGPSLPARGAGPSLPAPSARSRGAGRPWREQHPPGQPVGWGSRGRPGAAGRWRRGALRVGPGPWSPAGQDRARPRREAQPEQAPVCGSGSYPTPWTGEAASGEGAGGKWRPQSRGCEPRAPSPARRPRALSALPSPRRASSCRSCRLLSSAPRRSRPRPGRGTQPGRDPCLARSRPGPAATRTAADLPSPPGPSGFRTFPTVD